MRLAPLVALLGALSMETAKVFGGVIVYDNSKTPTGFYHDSRFECGDEIVLAGHERLVTEFYLEMFSDYVATGDETAQIRFYANDGPQLTLSAPPPGTLLYEGIKVPIKPGYIKIAITNIAVGVPDSFTWTMQVEGILPTEQAGLLFYNPPTVGQSEDDFWQDESGVWKLLMYPDQPNNFAARVVAVDIPPAVPPRITSITVTNGEATIVASVTPGKLYSLEFRDSFQAGSSWQRANNNQTIRATSSTVTFKDATIAGHPMRFYRLVERDTAIQASNDQFIITSYAIPGRRYQLQETSDFTHWTPVPNPVTATGNIVTFTVPKADGVHFYRVAQLD
jgi:hypothetical protein